MNNLLCSVLLLAVTTLILIDADCSTYPAVKNAYLNKDDQCDDTSITCRRFFKMKQMAKCEDGEWQYQEPVCEPLECDYVYVYTEKTYVKNIIIEVKKRTKQECNERCNNNTQCTSSILDSDGECFLYKKPIVATFYNVDQSYCITKCSEMNECLLLNYISPSKVCYLYNVTRDDLTDMDISNYDGYIMAEKFCQ
ncbi:hypothetical protein LOTGIDRAFT_174402 [Lottia gigantea]|uniref:Apple domain-containing protein n=1 Tax=Lottia gigantea TaxID=225164 RepID=V4C8K6_LOTGI|nr:hypothetical protein LOTGIDRAFT_174402 [Lottia gigantea]ESO98074.1 hypothetical protein LOTGIDRAFT_174402 [Lottia gigantea]